MKIVREYINEKFTQESDPIKDLGIGSKFYSIKPGDIIQTKKNIAVRDNNEIAFKNVEHGYFGKGECAVVIKVNRLENDVLSLTVAFFGNIENALKAQKVVLISGNEYYTRIGTAPIEK